MALNAAHNGYKEVAIPFYIDKDNILDGDEYFDCTLEDEAADPEGTLAAPEAAQETLDNTASRNSCKRSADEAGLEMN